MNIVSQQNACQLLETGIASSQNEQALKDVETANNLPAQQVHIRDVFFSILRGWPKSNGGASDFATWRELIEG